MSYVCSSTPQSISSEKNTPSSATSGIGSLFGDTTASPSIDNDRLDGGAGDNTMKTLMFDLGDENKGPAGSMKKPGGKRGVKRTPTKNGAIISVRMKKSPVMSPIPQHLRKVVSAECEKKQQQEVISATNLIAKVQARRNAQRALKVEKSDSSSSSD